MRSRSSLSGQSRPLTLEFLTNLAKLRRSRRFLANPSSPRGGGGSCFGARGHGWFSHDRGQSDDCGLGRSKCRLALTRPASSVCENCFETHIRINEMQMVIGSPIAGETLIFPVCWPFGPLRGRGRVRDDPVVERLRSTL